MTEMFAMFEEEKPPEATEPNPPAAAPIRPNLDDWESSLPGLMARFPNVKIGTLFCAYKVQLNPDLDFRDVQSEARLRAIPLSGRSLHQAKVLLGLEKPRPQAPRRKKAAAVDAADETEMPTMPYTREEEEAEERAAAQRTQRVAPLRPPSAMPAEGSIDLEGALRAAIAAAVETEAGRFREVIRGVLTILDEVLSDDDAPQSDD